LGNSLEIFLEKIFKKVLIFFLKKYYFVKVCIKLFPKNVIFKVFQIHFQVFLLLRSYGYKNIYTTFEGPNVNKIISYFENL
jgi:hypothetical protein